MKFSNPRKCLKLVENLFLGVAPFIQPAPPRNVIAIDDGWGNLRISVTTGRRVMAYGSKSAEIPCSYLC